MSGDRHTLGPVPRRQPRTKTLAEEAADRFYLLAKRDGRDGKIEALKAVKRGADVMTTAWCLAIAGRRSENGWPSQADYAAFWGIDERSAQREWHFWREVFGNPDVFGDQLDINDVAQRLVAEFGATLDKAEPQAGLSVPAAVLTA